MTFKKKAFWFLTCPDDEIQRRKIQKIMSKKKWDTASQKLAKCYFCPVFELINKILSTISLYNLCMKMLRSQVGDILSFQIKKKIKFQRFCPCGFLHPWTVNIILRFCCNYGFWHLIHCKQNVPDTWLCPSNSVPTIFYGNNHFNIYLTATEP